MMWLRIPQAIVSAHLAMLPRLQAEESMRHVTESGMGSGMKPGAWIKRQWGRFERVASGGSRARPANPGDLRSIGINRKVVPRGR